MDFSYAFLEKALSFWPFIVQIIIWGFSMRLTWSMALRWKEKYIIHNLPVVIQIELSKKDMVIEIQKAEIKKLRDSRDRLWVDNKMVNEVKKGKK